MALTQYIQEIRKAFAQTTSNYDAHARCQQILKDMSKDPAVFHEIVKKNMLRSDFHLKKRINPVIAFEIDATDDYSFIAHCLISLPDGDTETTHQSVHHHGNLLLTSVAPIGPGYSSILFKSDYSIAPDQTVSIEIDKIYHNHTYNIEFIEAYTPHVVFYPSDFSVTYALWSQNKRLGLAQKIKKSDFIQKNKALLKKVLVALGFSKTLDLNVIENFDFFPKGDKIVSLKDRVRYEVGSAESYYHNVCYILQKTGFTDKDFLRKVLLKPENKANPYLKKSIEDLINDVPLKATFEEIHIGIPEINFKRVDLMNALKK